MRMNVDGGRHLINDEIDFRLTLKLDLKAGPAEGHLAEAVINLIEGSLAAIEEELVLTCREHRDSIPNRIWCPLCDDEVVEGSACPHLAAML